MNLAQCFVAVLASVSATASLSTPLVSSDFETSAGGWVVANGARSFEWVASGGDPGGFVRARDLRGETLWYFMAPSDYLGDMLSAYGGTLSYRLKSNPTSPPIESAYADVQLLGANGVLLAFGGGIVPQAGWTAYAVPFVADGSWRIGSVSGAAASEADLLSVLSGLSELRIRGDYRQAVETTSLDSVVIAAVPEPGTVLTILAGLAFMAGIARRR